MSILDTFYILFKGDTTDLQKGQDKAGKSTKDLQDKIKGTNNDVQGLSVSFLDMAEKAAAALGVVIGVGAAVKSVFNSEQNALQVGMLSKQIGMTSTEVDGLAEAGKRFGGTTQGMLSNIQRIKEGLTFLTPYGGAGDFTPMPTQFSLNARRFGLKTFDGESVKQFYDSVNHLFQGMAPAKSNLIGAQLGLSPEEILMLQSTTEEYNKIYSESEKIGLLTSANTEKAFAFYQQWQSVDQVIRNLGVDIGSNVLTFLQKSYDLITKNKTVLENLGVEAKIVGAILAFAFAPWAVEMLVAVAPLYIILAALGGLYLLINKIGATKFNSWFSDIGVTVDWLTTRIGRLVGSLSALASGQGFKEAGKFLHGDYDDTNAALSSANKAINGAASSRIGSHTSSSIINNGSGQSSASVHIGEVNVHTQATDADGMASAAGSALKKHINYAIDNFNTSVLA